MQTNPKNRILQKAELWQGIAKNSRHLLSFEQCKAMYHALYADDPAGIAWLPDEQKMKRTHAYRMMQQLGIDDFRSLHTWSVKNREAFWQKAVHDLRIPFQKQPRQMLDMTDGAESPRWMPGASFNIAEACFMADPGKTAIVADDESGNRHSMSYGQLKNICNKVSGGLQKMGLTAGDRIVLYMPLSPEAVAAYLGILQAGMVAVLVADSFSAAELAKRIKASEAKALICYDVYLYNGKSLPIYQKVKEAEAPKSIVINSQNELRPNDLSWEDLLQDQTYTPHYGPADTLVSILFSSGTTSEPKAIPWTQLTPVKCATDARYHHDVHEEDVVTWTTGMGWMMGPWTIFAALMNQATLALFTGSAAGEPFGKFAQDSGINMLGTIPSLVKVWRASRVMEQYDWKVRVFSSTGEPSQTDDYLYLMWLQRFKAPVVEYCGGTEIGGGYITGSLLQPASPSTFSTPTLGTELYFRQGNSEALNQTEGGEVFIVPPAIGLSQQLLNRDHHLEYYANTPRLQDGTPLRRHGDNYHIFQPEPGMLFFKSKGRSDDSMNLGGIKISALEIEKIANQHPAVYESAAVAIAPVDGGPESLLLFVVPQSEVENLLQLKKEIQKMLTSDLNPLFRIGEVILREHLPRTASNKLMRRSLRREYQG
jgi:acetyl-CoA synthetase